MAHSIAQVIENRDELAKKLQDTSTCLQVTLDTMIAGRSIYNERRRLVLCNNAYKEIYSLPDDVARPGMSLAKIIRHYVKTHTGRDDSEVVKATIDWISSETAQLADNPVQIRTQTIADGRTIRVTTHAITSGGWTDIHEDITQECAELLQHEESLKTDQLTGLRNVTGLQASLEQWIADPSATPQVSVHVIEIANYGEIARERGLVTSFTIVKEIARLIREFSSESCIAGRVSDMTYILIQQISDFADVAARQSELKDSLPHSIEIPEKPSCPIGLRFRADCAAKPGEDILAIIDRAKPWSALAGQPAAHQANQNSS